MADIFVSYTSADRDWAFWIGQQLEKLGHTAHVHEWEISGGGDIFAWMEKYHHEANHILCVVSSEYLKAPYSALERRAAQWAAVSARPNFVLPVFVERCEAPTLLGSTKRCDLYDLNESEARVRLTNYLKPAARPAGPVPFPGSKLSPAGGGKLPPPGPVPFPGKAEPSTNGSGEGISNIPIRVPRHFLGRENHLAEMNRALKIGDGRAAILALYGLRGVGKTMLAAAYAERHRDSYRATWWIRAETEPTMRADLLGLGAQMNWLKVEDSDDKALPLVLERLRRDGNRILLIYDNATKLHDLSKFLPHGTGPDIIVTSNAPNWAGIATSIEIKVWPTDVGADFLLARTNRSTERHAALALSESLGGLPLAHEQAGAYCERIGLSLSEYRKRFEATPGNLLDDPSDSSREYRDGLTVAKTFALAIDQASALHAGAEPLIVYAALLAPEPIPLYLFSEGREKFSEPVASALAGDGLDEAVAALRAFALVERGSIVDEIAESGTTECIRLHRLVRQIASARRDTLHPGGKNRSRETRPRSRRLDAIAVAAERWHIAKPSSLVDRETALEDLISALNTVYPEGHSSNRVWQLLPHIAAVSKSLEDYDRSGARESLDQLARRVVMNLRVADDKLLAVLKPEYLAPILTEFYEVEPLEQAISNLFENYRSVWPALQATFLRANNYVLRYAMGKAIADAYCKETPLVTMDYITDLINADGVNEFEVGGYALNLIYARDPEKIDTNVLKAFAERPEYCGRSILGDLLLNLVFERDRKLDLRRLVPSNRFWRPIWDFIEVDVHAIEAAGYVLASSRPSNCHENVEQDFENFRAVQSRIKIFLQLTRRSPTIVGMLNKYLSLGQDTETISKSEDDLASLSQADLREVLSLLFAHPIWAVGEAAASILARRVEDNGELMDIVKELLQHENWRVRYGACEAAFILSDTFREVFFDSVHQYFNDLNPKVRGLCAENLCSFILNSSVKERRGFLIHFKDVFDSWLTNEEDCWVLEHIFRFYQALNKRHVDVEALLPSRLSRLLEGSGKWYTRERGEFLRFIEQRKEEIERVNL